MDSDRAIASRVAGSRLAKPLWILPTALAFIAALTFAVSVIEFEKDRERLSADLLLTTRAMSRSVDVEMSGVIETTRVLAALLANDLVNRNYTGAHQKLTEAVASSNFAHHIVLTDQSGQQVLNTVLAFGQPLPVTKNMRRIEEMFLSPKPRVSNLTIGTVSRLPQILVDVPVMHQGKVICVMTSVLDTDDLLKVLTEQKLPAEWIANIFDANSVVVARTREQDKFVGKKVSERLLAQLAKQNAGVYENVNLEGITTIAAFERSEKFGYGVTVGVPKSLVMKQAASALPVPAIAISLAVFGLLVAFHFANNAKYRRLSEEQSRENEATLRGILNSVDMAVALLDENGVILKLNHEWERFGSFDQSAPEIWAGIGANYLDACEAAAAGGHADAGRLQAGIVGLLKGEASSFQIEYPLNTGAGELWLKLSANHIHGTEGRVVVTQSDVTTLKLALRDALEASEMAENARVPIALVDNDKRYRMVNRTYAEHVGQPLEKVLGRHVWEVLGEDAYRSIEKYMDSALSGLTQRFSLNRNVGGVSRSFDATYRTFYQDGQIIGFVASLHDISELVETQKALQHHQDHLEELVQARTRELEAAEARLQLVIDSAADCIIELDATGRICMVNPATQAVLGYGPEALIGRNIHDAIHSRYPDGSEFPASECAVVRSVIAGQKMRLDSDVFWHADGRPVPVAVATHPIWHGEQVSGAVMTFFDCTERNQIDREREEARQAAVQLAKLKSEFLANMSHEIRTPLNGVLGMAQIGYRDSAGRTRTQEIFARILESGKLLLTVINDILDFSKIEAGKLNVESDPCDPGALVDAVVHTLEGQAAAKNIRLVGEKTPDLPAACLGDPVRISQILLNLVSNGVKFTAQGEVRLSLAKEDDELVFRVSDTGLGIHSDQIQRMFMPFEQADSSTTREFGGTGLGLAISRRLAELMEGSLTATSELGQGSTFTLRIPLRAAEESGASVRPMPSFGTSRLSGLHILLAEDNAVNQMVLTDFLEQEGAMVTVVGNGELALEAVRQNASFDAVLMDVQMPVMDGIEATRKLKEANTALPVIGQTAHAMKEEHDRCLAAGMVATIAKPIDIELLVATLLDQLKVASERPAVPEAVAVEALPPVEKVVDWDALVKRYPKRRGFIERLLEMALRDHEMDAHKLRELIYTGDHFKIGRLAHALKGVAGNLCAAEVGKAAVQVMHAVEQEGAKVPEHAEALAMAMDRLIDALRQVRPECSEDPPSA